MILIFMSLVLVYLIRDFVYARKHTKINLFSTMSVTQQLTIATAVVVWIGTIVDINEAFHPTRYIPVLTFKLGALAQLAVACILLSIFLTMTLFLNLSLSWAEIAKSSKKLRMTSTRRNFTRYTFVLRFTQFLYFLASAASIILSRVDIITFTAIPVGLIIIASFTVGSKGLIDLLKDSPTGSSQHEGLANRIKTTSLGLVISLVIYISTAIVQQLYSIFVAGIARTDLAASPSDRPIVVISYIGTFGGDFAFIVLARYFHQTLRKKEKSNKETHLSPTQSDAKVKDSSEDKVVPARVNSISFGVSHHTNG